MILSVETLIRKWLKAQKLVRQRGRILEGLNESCTQDDRNQWQTEMDEILEKRITDPGIMDDFLSSVETGTVTILCCLSLFFDKTHRATESRHRAYDAERRGCMQRSSRKDQMGYRRN